MLKSSFYYLMLLLLLPPIHMLWSWSYIIIPMNLSMFFKSCYLVHAPFVCSFFCPLLASRGGYESKGAVYTLQCHDSCPAGHWTRAYSGPYLSLNHARIQRAYMIPGIYPKIVRRRHIQNSICKTKQLGTLSFNKCSARYSFLLKLFCFIK